MDVREKLVELQSIITCPNAICNFCEHFKNKDACEKHKKEVIADNMIAHGVTVQECGHWVSYQSDEPYGCEDEKEWHKCSKCGNDAYGRCYEDEWYSAPILSAYCPHCGAKMMLQPPKGE